MGRRGTTVTIALVLWSTPVDTTAQRLFEDDFELGLAAWEVHGVESAFIHETRDPDRGRVLVLRPNGDAHVLIRGSERWEGIRFEGSVLFPEDVHNYLGVIYNFVPSGDRRDFGDDYIKGNGSYLQVNPHRDYNVGRTLYPEMHVDLDGPAGIAIGAWQRFRVEVVGSECHVYVGDMDVPQLTFSALELDSGAIGLQPRSVGGDVWVDDVSVTEIERLSYSGPPIPVIAYEPGRLVGGWQVLGPFERAQDEAARSPRSVEGWRPFDTDTRGAVITGRVVDTLGPGRVAYFRTVIQTGRAGRHLLRLSTVDDLAVWVNGRFHWFVPRQPYAWHDVAAEGPHQGQAIPIDLLQGRNDIVLRVIGGVYASGGFFAAVEGPSQ
jgi:hypothetical protein